MNPRSALLLTFTALLLACDPAHTGYIYVRPDYSSGSTLSTEQQIQAEAILEEVAIRHLFTSISLEENIDFKHVFYRKYQWHWEPDLFRDAWLSMRASPTEITYKFQEFVSTQQTPFMKSVEEDILSTLEGSLTAVTIDLQK